MSFRTDHPRSRCVPMLSTLLLTISLAALLLLVWGMPRRDPAVALPLQGPPDAVRQQVRMPLSGGPDPAELEASPASKAETLTGEAAKEQLRKSGQFESLGAAFQAARYAAERIDPAGPHSRGAEFFAANPGQKLRAWFGRDGVELASGRASAKGATEDDGKPWSVALRLRAAGREGSLEPVSASTSNVEGNRVELRDPSTAITQWFENRKEGVEQGFTLAARPEGEAREVALLLGVEGTLRAEAMEGQQSVRFVDAAGAEVLQYTGLKAWDAAGRVLPSRVELRGSEIALLVADAGAKYPITVDPLFANVEARLLKESVGAHVFGGSVGLSGDTALIGAHEDSTAAAVHAGSVYVFVRNGATWNQQAKLTAGEEDQVDLPEFGWSVALSADTALIGAHRGTNDQGSAYVFVRSGTSWNQQAKLTAEESHRFGHSVALNGDTALIGSDSRSAYVFVRSGTSWNQQAKLTAESDRFGSSVALSGDTAVIGAPNWNSPVVVSAGSGSAYVFVRSGTSWNQQAKLTADESDAFGLAVAVSGDTAVIGAPGVYAAAGLSAGSAYVFVRSGTNWSRQAKLIADDGAERDGFGGAVALSENMALIAAQAAGAYAGGAYLFGRSGTNWSQQAKLVADEGGERAEFGRSVALGGDTALVGSPGDGAGAGSGYVFVRSGVSWSQQAKLIIDDGAERDEFGRSVALNGDTALIGAHADETVAGGDAGSAYVFVRSEMSWSQQAKLTASDGAAGDEFGYAVALGENTALIGSLDGGSAYVFVRNGTQWSQQATLTASDGKAGRFGSSVALSGETALVGAFWLRDTGIGRVAVGYVFVRSGTIWSEQARLIAGGVSTPNDEWEYEDHGSNVALSGDTALIGSDLDETLPLAYTGSAYVFVRSGTNWSQQATLIASDGERGDNFGWSVALSGDTALIGAVEDVTPSGIGAGSAYVFVRSGTSWSQQAKLTAGDGAAGDEFGNWVALSGNTALIGAHYDDDYAGSAYLFGRSGTNWSQYAKLSAGVDRSSSSSFGSSVALSGDTALIGAKLADTFARNAGSAYVFLVGQLPEINVQPVSRTVIPGMPVTFSVTASGYAPLRYQWRKNAFEIAGANTSGYSIPSVTEGDAGTYDVIVSNIGGTATSAAATLAVNALSHFTQDFPDAAPAAQGFVLVNLGPAELLTASGIKPAWRFVGEQEWRLPGVPVGGLATGDRQIEFRPVPGYLHPLRETVSVISGAAATVLEREYYDTQGGTTGGLSVTLKPESLADPAVPLAERAQWRLLGQDDGAWQNSGATLAGLVPGIYLVDCKPITGRATPPPISVAVREGETRAATATYFLENAPIGTLPGVLPFETVSTSETLPYAFVGQLRSDLGAATGFVVKPRVVATAAHAVFDEGTLSYTTGTQWLFQRDRGTYEPKPQSPRGFYIFEGYAAQRAAEGTPGESSPQSQHLDVAALYFLEDAGRGGSSGYLGSDADDNEWLLSSEPKILSGYPVDSIGAEFQGRMHATPAANVKFTRAFGRTFTTADITTFGGTSGGPLCVRYDDGKYYPAAIYLGGSAQTVVRAIDSGVIDLFNRAEVSANGGNNNTGQGIVHVNAPTSGNTFAAASLQVNLSPSGAVQIGARWKLGNQGSVRASGVQLDSLSPGNYTIHCTPVPGFQTPAPRAVTLIAGAVATVAEIYVPLGPPRITSVASKQGTRGEPLLYQIEASGMATSFGITGELPIGMSFETAEAQIAGVPQQSGRFPIVVSASNAFGSDSFPVTLRIAPLLENQTAVVSRGQELGYRIATADSVNNFGSGVLPVGLVLDSASGLINGASSVSGVFQVPISISNEGGSADAILTLTVRPVPEGVDERSARIGQPFAPFQITSPDTIGSYGASNLPPGLTIDPQTGVISGTPTESGTFDATVSVTNEGGTGTIPLRFIIEQHFTLFEEVAGTYTGLALEKPVATVASAAFTRLTVSATGALTGVLTIGREKYRLAKGRFLSTGKLEGQFLRNGKSPISAALRLSGLPGQFQITGKVNVDGGELDLVSDRAGFHAKLNPAPQHGTYTFSVARAGNPAAPQGHGYGWVKVSAAGAVRVVGVAGDGNAISQSANLSARATWPFFACFGNGSALLAGEMAFRDRPLLSDFDGSLAWIPGPAARASTAPLGGEVVEVLGSRHSAISISQAPCSAVFGGGGLSSPTEPIPLAFDSRGRSLPSSGSVRVTVDVAPDTGLFRGTFLMPGAVNRTSLSGALLQKSHSGGGLFRGVGGVTGFVEISPIP